MKIIWENCVEKIKTYPKCEKEIDLMLKIKTHENQSHKQTNKQIKWKNMLDVKTVHVKKV